MSFFDTGGRLEMVRHDLFRYSSRYGLIEWMATISESEFERIVEGIFADRDKILKHNPIGTPSEVLLWMLMSCLVSYLSLGDTETPCFTGRPDAGTYREAIGFILRSRKASEFDESPYLDKLSQEC